MSISSQEASPRLFPQSDAGGGDVEVDTDAGLLPTTATSTITEDSRLFADRIWQAVARDVQLISHAGSAGEQKGKKTA
ncbi:MAG: hypothetical protein DME49_13270 [Verrucomicrobia bacterium]|nr:MAG: hypothetical protein DME49_13270 [Verrucomicrobiota bacterium]PYK93314.1 MAG: hypothetical protein DME36_09765 [Verrucomicrobiota bacterium]